MGLEVLFKRPWPTLMTPNNAGFDLRGDTLFKSHEDIMLTGGDFNLNYVQRYTDSLKEVLKQTMLKHDSILKRQVQELHRLYRIQKTLMDDLSWKEFDRYTSGTISTQSTPIPFEDPPKHKPLAEGKSFSTWPIVDPTQTANWDWLESQGAYSKLHERCFDLQLPAEDYISHVGTEFPKKELWVSMKESTKGNNFLYDNYISNAEEVKLTLSTGKDPNKKGSTSGTSYDKQTCSSTVDVIDLEKSIERVSNEEPKSLSSINFEASTTYDECKHSLQIPIPYELSFARRERKDLGHKLFTNCSVEDSSEGFQEWKSLSIVTGLNECRGSSSSVNLFNRKQHSTSYDTTRLDLNRVQLDESPCFSSAHVVTFPSPAESSSSVLRGLTDESHKGTDTIATWWRKPNNSCSNETHELLQQDKSVHSTLTDSEENYTRKKASARSTKFRANSGSEVGLIDLESVPDDPLEPCEKFGNQGFKPGEENVDLSLGRKCDVLHDYTQMDNSVVTLSSKLVGDHLYAAQGGTVLPQTPGNAEIGKVSYVKSEEDTVSSSPCQNCVVVQDRVSPAASKFDCVTDRNSCNRKDLQSGTEDKHELGDSIFSAFAESGTTRLGSQLTETCKYDPNVKASVHAYLWEKSCNQSMPKDQDCEEQKQEATEMDDLVRRAAESLIHISLENSVCSQDFFSNAGSEELENEQSSRQPQYSSDSFESNVLRLKESCVDDYSLTSEPIEVKETENGSGVKLRRGRRLKDFQKDILPGLMSLSRQEIYEDIYSIGLVIKSNEFRKNQSKRVSGKNWCVPTRSRRPRFNYFD